MLLGTKLGIKCCPSNYLTDISIFYRTVLVTAAVVLAILVPKIAPFIGLIGAFCFSILGLLVPVRTYFKTIQTHPRSNYKHYFLIDSQVAIEMVTYWDEGFGKWNWIIIKNVVVVVFGIMALIFGSMSAIKEIIGPSNAR